MREIPGSSEKIGFSRPLDARLEPRAQSPGMGDTAVWEAWKSCLPSVFEQLTWQRDGPDKHLWLSEVSSAVCIFRTRWCYSDPWHFFLLWLSLVRSWWVGGTPVLTSPFHCGEES